MNDTMEKGCSSSPDQGLLNPVRTNLSLYLLLAVGVLMVGQTLLWFFLWSRGLTVAEEHGPMEITQAALLGVGLLLLGRSAWVAGPGPQRVLHCGLMLLYGTFLLLEVDTRDFGIKQLDVFFNGIVRNLWLGGLWVWLGVAALRCFWPLWRTFRQWLPGCAGLLLCASGALWITSRVVEQLHLFPEAGFFPEELVETNAALLMLAAALAGPLRSRRVNKT
jgi:hypothetical protein